MHARKCLSLGQHPWVDCRASWAARAMPHGRARGKHHYITEPRSASRLCCFAGSDRDLGVRCHVSTLPGGPEMVGVLDSSRSQQSGHHSSSVRPYHQYRCILTGLGRNLKWHVNGGTLERGGGRTTHQLFGTEGSHSSFEGFPKSRHAVITPESGPSSPTSYPSGNGQYNRRSLCEQEGVAFSHLLCPY